MKLLTADRYFCYWQAYSNIGTWHTILFSILKPVAFVKMEPKTLGIIILYANHYAIGVELTSEIFCIFRSWLFNNAVSIDTTLCRMIRSLYIMNSDDLE
jgi:hypothetical protein